MRNKKRLYVLYVLYVLMLVMLFVTLYLPQMLLAQTVGGYDLTWNVVGGSEVSTGNSYELRGVSGQASVNMLEGNGYMLGGGFFGGGAALPPEYTYLYLPLILRGL
jgi:hypothetical protein